MAQLRSVCVYCGSGVGSRPVFATAAEQLGRALAEHGIRLVYGGGSVGLMGVLARTAVSHGGAVVGIIPHFLKQREVMLASVPELIVTADMHERKRLMFERSEAFVALPGGIGTLEELVEILTWAQLGQHAKPILIANIDGFWDPLLALLAHMRREGFIHNANGVRPIVVDAVEDIIPRLQEAVAGIPQEMVDLGAGGEPYRDL